jgi:hypothetical protein
MHVLRYISICDLFTDSPSYIQVLKVPRQCPLTLVLEVQFGEGKALRSEEGNALGSELGYGQRKEVEQVLYCA